jgi:hypothetical protein
MRVRWEEVKVTVTGDGLEVVVPVDNDDEVIAKVFAQKIADALGDGVSSVSFGGSYGLEIDLDPSFDLDGRAFRQKVDTAIMPAMDETQLRRGLAERFEREIQF